MQRFFGWWYRLTSIPEPVGQVSPTDYEMTRRSRLLSTIVFSLLLIFIVFVPACLALPNHFVLVVDIGMMPFCIIALILNRARHPYLAGGLLVISFEAALVLVILTTQPFDEPSIQQYELFVFGELLAVSLLNARSVFLVGIFNSLFIGASLAMINQGLIPAQQAMLTDLHSQFLPVLVRPIAVQMLVAGVTYLWVANATSHMTRAYKAEITATAAQRAAEEQEARERQLRIDLQENIQRVVHTYAEAMNSRVTTKIAISDYDPVLWPLINVFNSLQNRLQHVNQVEQEVLQLHQAIATCTELIYQNESFIQNPAPTRTALDQLLIALKDRYYAQTHGGNRITPPFK